MIEALKARLTELNDHADRAKADGAIAPANVWIDAYSVKGVNYARARPDQPIFDGGKKLMALGRVGSDRHEEYKFRIQRRDALADIERRSLMIQDLIDAELTQPIWKPAASSKVVSKIA